MSETRKLVEILVSDVVGYSRLAVAAAQMSRMAKTASSIRKKKATAHGVEGDRLIGNRVRGGVVSRGCEEGRS
jgi:hypothetical protein